jgi:hypothetical protein
MAAEDVQKLSLDEKQSVWDKIGRKKGQKARRSKIR